MALNAIDGMLAREFNQQSTLGAILNEIGDLISDAALYMSFVFLPGVSSWLVMLMIFLSWLSEFCGVISQALTGIRDYHGPLGKSDRAFLFGASGLVIACWPQYTVMLNFVFGISLPLLMWTCINRCRRAMERKNV
jgi:phosphatidylglycerophosphate synthase